MISCLVKTLALPMILQPGDCSSSIRVAVSPPSFEQDLRLTLKTLLSLAEVTLVGIYRNLGE